MFKKIIATFSLAAMVISVSPVLSEAATKTSIKYVNVSSTLNVRKSASTKASVVTRASKGAQVKVYSNSNGWSKITVYGKQGYVSSKYLSSSKPGSAPAANYRSKAVSVAKSHLGVKYRWGGTTPSGFDCSGLVKYSFGKAGKALPRTAADMYKSGSRVSALQTGDLLFFAPNKASRPTHVQMYVGSGKVIQSSSSQGVSYSTTSNSYWKPKYIGAKRI